MSFEIGKKYLFRIKNQSSDTGFIYYTGKIEDIDSNILFVYTVRNEKITIHKDTILNSMEM